MTTWPGKSSLAKELVSLAGGSHIQVDDFLSTPPNGRTYLEQVKCDELMNKISVSARPIFLDCFVLLDVMKKMKLKADYFIFCHRTTDTSSIRFDQKQEAVSDSYEQRRNPLACSNKIIRFGISFV
jgi:hypothetical protein